MTLKLLWPRQGTDDTVLNPDADVVQEPAVVLATHQPMRFVQRAVGNVAASELGTKDRRVTEEEFLDYFLSPAEDYLLAPVTGPSGCGKSHAVVWLEAQLLRRQDSGGREIIRIPKGSSFRGVLSRILQAYDPDATSELQKRVDQARQTLTAGDARFHLEGSVRKALSKELGRTEQALQSLRNNAGASGSDESLRAKGKRLQTERRHLEGLGYLIGDNFFREHHFFIAGGAIARIAERAVSGSHPQDDATHFQIEASDLLLSSDLDRRVQKEASEKAAEYYLHNLAGTEAPSATSRGRAAKLLRRAVDQAVPELYQIGGNELTEVFCELREMLAAHEPHPKELVFLIEDFSVLAGLQGTLLDAMTTSRRRTGNKPMCLMRTALAVTDGYISERDTVATRARFEFRIEPEVVDDERIVDFVARYLNAERHGKGELQRAYGAGANLTGPWMPAVIATEDAFAASFGLSRAGIPLFPFNRSAIREFLALHLRPGQGGLLFHPRTIVNVLLVDVFRKQHAQFASGVFPPPSLSDYLRDGLHDDVARDLAEVGGLGQSDLGRASVLIRFWGGNPRTVAEAALLDSEEFGAFGCPRPPALVGLSEPRPQDPDSAVVNEGDAEPEPEAEPASEPEPRPPTESRPNPELERWEELLRTWRNGRQLPTAEANVLRQQIWNMAIDSVDWSVEPVRIPLGVLRQEHKFVLLGNAAGGTSPKTARVNANGEGADPTANAPTESLRSAIRGLVWLDHHKWSWSFDGAGHHYGALMLMASVWRDSFLAWYRKQPDVVGLEARLHGYRASLTGAPPVASDPAGLAALFASDSSARTGVPGWANAADLLEDDLGSRRELLLAGVGLRAGGVGSDGLLLCVDGGALLRSLSALDAHRGPSDERPGGKRFAPSTVRIAKDLAGSWAQAIQEQSSWLMTAGRDCLELTGDETDPQDLFEVLRNMTELAEQSGIARDAVRPVLFGLERCRDSDFEASLASLRGAVAAAGWDNPTANALAPGARKDVQDLVNLVAAVEALLQACEEHVRGESLSPESRSATVRSQIAQNLESVAEDI